MMRGLTVGLAAALVALAAPERAAAATCVEMATEYNRLAADYNDLVSRQMRSPGQCEFIRKQLPLLRRMIELTRLVKSCPGLSANSGDELLSAALKGSERELDACQTAERRTPAAPRPQDQIVEAPRSQPAAPPVTAPAASLERVGAQPAEATPSRLVFGWPISPTEMFYLIGAGLMFVIGAWAALKPRREFAHSMAGSPGGNGTRFASATTMIRRRDKALSAVTARVSDLDRASVTVSRHPVSLVPLDGGPGLTIDRQQLEVGPLQIGRTATSDIILTDEYVSARHARMWIDDRGLLMIEDLGSTNGTYRGRDRIARARLRRGDVVSFGKLSYRVHY